MPELRIDMALPAHTRYLSLIGTVGEEVAKVLEPYRGDRDALAFAINLALTEAVTNAIRHSGAQGRPLHVAIQCRPNELSIRVHDQGPGFDLASVPHPDLDHPTEGGLGLFLMRTFMDSVDYRRARSGNVLEMRKKLS